MKTRQYDNLPVMNARSHSIKDTAVDNVHKTGTHVSNSAGEHMLQATLRWREMATVLQNTGSAVTAMLDGQPPDRTLWARPSRTCLTQEVGSR